ncbi:MAG: alpha/beta hydrolase [Gemmatimonadetes bacterium]|nr:alpha/beta hydrolase [Gemmatimonadota bacterium]
MLSPFYPLLSHPWGGVAIGAVIAAIGVLLLVVSRRPRAGQRTGRTRLARGLGVLVTAFSVFVLAAAAISMLEIRRLANEHPPPGTLVDVGGYRMHILAEGDAGDGPTVIWIPGGHAQGLALHHLHSAIRGETRSILFDRPGTGWSDPGPYPRRTATEAAELATLLEQAGEEGPFVLAGHSYGGLLAANYARRHPERTAAVVLLDASPPDAFIYAPAYGAAALDGLVRDAERQGLDKIFGGWTNPESAMAETETEIGEILRKQRRLLADVGEAMAANARRPAASFATASIFQEFSPGIVSSAAPDLVVYDGELGDMPVLVVIPDDPADAIIDPLGMEEAAASRARNFFVRTRVRYLEVSSDARLVHTPPGTGHNYPYETPEFVLDVIRQLLAELSGDHTEVEGDGDSR